MADKTGIEWTEATWNPISGCTKTSTGCKHCYAERDWGRLQHLPAYAGRAFTDVAMHAARLDQPLRWKRPRRVFVNSMSDLFHEAVPEAFIDQVFAVMALATQHTFQTLTKRPVRMRDYMNGLNLERLDRAARGLGYTLQFEGRPLRSLPLPNVWLGVSVEDQAAADERIPLLLDTRAAVRWISAEPLLGPVRLIGLPGLPTDDEDVRINALKGEWVTSPRAETGNAMSRLDWVVVGGESGPKARPMHPDWARSLRDQCAAAGVPFLFKQWGEWVPHGPIPGGDEARDLRNGIVQYIIGDGREFDGHFRRGDAAVRRVGKNAAGRLLDGVQHDEYPSSIS